MKRIKENLRELHESEDGITLVELMVSIVLIAGVLIASAFAMNAAFEAQQAGEIKSRAVELAREEIVKDTQRSYVETRLVIPSEYWSGEIPVPATWKGEQTITHKADRINPNGDLEDIGLKYIQTKEINGTKFTVKTFVTRVTNASFDGAGANIQLNNANINGKLTAGPLVKRITVIVTWSTGDGVKQTATTAVRSPDPSECIPPRVEPNGGAGASRWDANDFIQACELRK